MQTEINTLTTKELREFIHSAVKEAMEDFMEDFIASSSSNYINSIKEAREDYKSGRVVDMQDLLNE